MANEQTDEALERDELLNVVVDFHAGLAYSLVLEIWSWPCVIEADNAAICFVDLSCFFSLTWYIGTGSCSVLVDKLLQGVHAVDVGHDVIENVRDTDIGTRNKEQVLLDR